MDRDLKNNIISLILVTLFSAVGFFVGGYIEKQNQTEQFVHQLQKELYDKGATEIGAVRAAKSSVISKFHEKPGLTSYELEKEYKILQEALGSFWEYIEELKRYGSSEQIELASELEEWYRFSYAEIHTHYKQAENVQETVRKLLLIENTKTDWFKGMNATLENEIEGLVRNENRLYYTLRIYRSPVENSFEQYFYYLFRNELGLTTTSDMAKSINSIPVLIKEYKEFSFKEKAFPFVFGTGRIFQSPKLEYKGDVEGIEKNNQLIHHQLKVKFIAQVIEQDANLQNILKSRKETE
jgi:hypothetical protein